MVVRLNLCLDILKNGCHEKTLVKPLYYRPDNTDIPITKFNHNAVLKNSILSLFKSSFILLAPMLLYPTHRYLLILDMVVFRVSMFLISSSYLSYQPRYTHTYVSVILFLSKMFC